jgi:hypothetical protein
MPPKKISSLLPKAQAPTPLLFCAVTPDWQGVFSALSKLDVKKPIALIGVILQATLALVTLKPRDAGEEAFLLIKRAMVRALCEVAKSALGDIEVNLKQVRDDFAKTLDRRLRSVPIELTSKFYISPGRIQIVGATGRLLASWLREAGLLSADADSEVLALPAYFTSALQSEISNNSELYPKLIAHYKPQFAKAGESETAWLRYHVALCTRANPLVLDLNVSLEDVYVELRAFTVQRLQRVENKDEVNTFQKAQIVGNLHDLAEHWIEDPEDAIFVISGGPGAGKSAFAKRFSAWKAWTGPGYWRVLYIPLHRFKIASELEVAIQDFAFNELECPVSLFDRSDDGRLLIVFDGLDELAQQGVVGEELAIEFYRQVVDFTKFKNAERNPIPVKVMICGRDVAVSSTSADSRRGETVRYLLPYVVQNSSRIVWKGQPALVEFDQRDEWWKNYGVAIGDQNITSMPDDIRTRNLDPLTAEPILNGLIAQCRHAHTLTSATNRAMIYGWLLIDVLNRVHDKSGKKHLLETDNDHIVRLLEEVAVTAWQSGDVRSTTKTRVQERCQKSDQMEILNRVFPDKQKSDISPLFLAFYFQEADSRQDQERAFEFSHKSFGEFLLARRILRFLDNITTRFEKCTTDKDFAILRWAELSLVPKVLRHSY